MAVSAGPTLILKAIFGLNNTVTLYGTYCVCIPNENRFNNYLMSSSLIIKAIFFFAQLMTNTQSAELRVVGSRSETESVNMAA